MGPDRIILYNDSYIDAVVDRHPEILGQPLHLAWCDVWDQLKGSIHKALEGSSRFFCIPDV